MGGTHGRNHMPNLFGSVCPCCGQPALDIPPQPFNEFWSSWPDKRAKHPAQVAWSKLSAPEQKIAMERTEAWCREWRKRNADASHILAATYLNQRRFLDTPETAATVDPEKHDLMIAGWIKEGKAFLLGSVTASRAAGLVARGMVTEEECRKVGVL